jgi:hypothetical protein
VPERVLATSLQPDEVLPMNRTVSRIAPSGPTHAGNLLGAMIRGGDGPRPSERHLEPITQMLRRTSLGRYLRSKDVALHRSERRVWTVMVIASTAWGIVSGVSFAQRSFLIRPVTGVIGCLALGVLLATLYAWGRAVERS